MSLPNQLLFWPRAAITQALQLLHYALLRSIPAGRWSHSGWGGAVCPWAAWGCSCSTLPWGCETQPTLHSSQPKCSCLSPGATERTPRSLFAQWHFHPADCMHIVSQTIKKIRHERRESFFSSRFLFSFFLLFFFLPFG